MFAHSLRFVLPRSTAPAARSRSTMNASLRATAPRGRATRRSSSSGRRCRCCPSAAPECRAGPSNLAGLALGVQRVGDGERVRVGLDHAWSDGPCRSIASMRARYFRASEAAVSSPDVNFCCRSAIVSSSSSEPWSAGKGGLSPRRGSCSMRWNAPRLGQTPAQERFRRVRRTEKGAAVNTTDEGSAGLLMRDLLGRRASRARCREYRTRRAHQPFGTPPSHHAATSCMIRRQLHCHGQRTAPRGRLHSISDESRRGHDLDPEHARAAIELLHVGFARQDIDIPHGEEDLHRRDPSGAEHRFSPSFNGPDSDARRRAQTSSPLRRTCERANG